MSTLHVSPPGSDTDPGDASSPLRTIGRAAALARPGDTVLVHAGVYREWVKPRRGGRSPRERITYEAAPGEHVVIKGSERVTSWTQEAGTVWRADVPNSLFGDFNPFAETLFGDWLAHRDPSAAPRHLGDVYLNGRSFYEVDSRWDLLDPPLRATVVDDWTGLVVPVPDTDQTRHVWHAEVGPERTTIRANFHGADPNAELVEISVRRSVFQPLTRNLDHITVRGFELAQAASPWAPPTADQPGLIGPNWAKGWIIEDNDIHDAKCAAVSLGKEASTGHNHAAERGDKPGHQYQLETVFSARQTGWDAEHVGGHIVRRNRIHRCGQNAIVGNLGCAFSTIEDNHIHDIATKREFYGYEIAGIKLHAAIDVILRGNVNHDCSLGVWLDWQAQGTRVTRNVLFDNSRDLFVEVSHGPYLIDNNILASPASLEIFSQGGAYLHNLVAGTIRVEPVPDRATPYHRPHSTQVAGYATVQSGDDRFIGNLFVPGHAAGYRTEPGPPATTGRGTAVYDGHPASGQEYRRRLADQPPGDHSRFAGVPQPVLIRDNAYATGATPYADETRPVTVGDAEARVHLEGDRILITVDLPAAFQEVRVSCTGLDLPRTRMSSAEFEERDGSVADLSADLLGAGTTPRRPPGPIAALRGGRNEFTLPLPATPRLPVPWDAVR